MEYPTLRIAHLYPSLLNVAGDGGNVMALVQRCAWRGIPTEVVEVEQGDTPDFTTFDLILFHGGQDVEMDVVARDLGLKIPSLRDAADQGVLIFAVCAGLQLLGHRYIPSVGEPMEGAAILDLETRGGSQRFMQHAAIEVTLNGQTGDGGGLREPLRPDDPRSRGQAVRHHGRGCREQRAGRHRGSGPRQRLRHLPPRPGSAQEPVARRPADHGSRSSAGPAIRSSSRRWMTPPRIGRTRWPWPRPCATRASTPPSPPPSWCATARK